MNKSNDKKLYYFLMSFVFICIFSFFESAIILNNLIPDISSKLFWSGMNFFLIIGLPIFIFCVNKLMK